MDSIPPKRYNWIFGLKFYDRRKLKSRNGGLLETKEYKVRNSDAKNKKSNQTLFGCWAMAMKIVPNEIIKMETN